MNVCGQFNWRHQGLGCGWASYRIGVALRCAKAISEILCCLQGLRLAAGRGSDNRPAILLINPVGYGLAHGFMQSRIAGEQHLLPTFNPHRPFCFKLGFDKVQIGRFPDVPGRLQKGERCR